MFDSSNKGDQDGNYRVRGNSHFKNIQQKHSLCEFNSTPEFGMKQS